MSKKDIFDEALIVVSDIGCLDEINDDGIYTGNRLNQTFDIDKVEKALKLGKLYQKRAKLIPCMPGCDWDELHELDRQIKDLEDKK